MYAAPQQPGSPLSTWRSTAPLRHAEADSFSTMMGRFARSESMDVSNDPRFFTPNVLDKRFAAFSGLSVCATLFTQTALSACFDMKKDWDLGTIDGAVHLSSFALMNFVLFFNIMAAFTSVAQLYLTYRLMTAGPTGFEVAKTFYLNPNIAFWRHAAIKMMLLSLPVFLMACALRIFVRIDEEMPGRPVVQAKEFDEERHFLSARLGGVSLLALLTFTLWSSVSLLLLYIHNKHIAIFRHVYGNAKDAEAPLVANMRMLSGRGARVDH